MSLLFAVAGVGLVGGCDGAGSQADVGTVTIALSQVPSDVACVRTTVSGTRTVTRSFDVTPGQSTVLTLNGLPIGSDTFSVVSFDTACAQVGSASVPNWTGDPVTANVNSAMVAQVMVTLSRNGRAAVSIDFNDNPTSATQPLTVKNPLSWCSVSVNGGIASSAAAQTVNVAPGTINLSAGAVSAAFRLGATPWHDTSGDTGSGDPGTRAGDQSATTVVVGNAPKCVWVCCELSAGGGCPTTDQCP